MPRYRSGTPVDLDDRPLRQERWVRCRDARLHGHAGRGRLALAVGGGDEVQPGAGRDVPGLSG